MKDHPTKKHHTGDIKRPMTKDRSPDAPRPQIDPAMVNRHEHSANREQYKATQDRDIGEREPHQYQWQMPVTP